MRILVTGSTGMLGSDLVRAITLAGDTALGADLQTSGRAWQRAVDVTDGAAVDTAIAEADADVVIHAAALTDVDGCELDPEQAFRVNAWGTWSVAAACARHDVPLLYLSTDFVFDGASRKPYTEYDAPNPINVYGASKLAGEGHVITLCRRHWIVRTQWLFGRGGRNFPATILKLAESRTELPVVRDQIGAPTYTVDLAAAIVTLIRSGYYGTYHVNNAGSCSWYDLALFIMQQRPALTMEIKPIPASEYITPTRRPAYSVLDRMALRVQAADTMRSWQAALTEFLATA
ncbi:MAG: dTDP-4-dehydrorhamnose reductase [Armatimonadetes bacterium]|nr:dTDP-4-dehydrorhamnose reductase [Armatimonadota bacterium]MDE2205568.1 dTDP-4-dehydrorhamnose reductase [Armatimonadota bacterium]